MTGHARRILVADDEAPVRRAFEDALSAAPPKAEAMTALEDELFGKPAGAPAGDKRAPLAFEVAFAAQGEEAVEAVRRSQETNAPFAVVFLDMRMPPGIDGAAAAKRIRELDPFVNIVLVTGYSDVDVPDIAAAVPPADKLFFIAKPFQVAEIRQQAAALSARWLYESELVRELKSQNAGLRTAAEQARAARFEAEKANIAKSSFLANVSHELRTPLNAIIGFSDIMAGELYGAHADARYLDYSKEINASGVGLLGSIDDIIDTARLDIGKIELSPERLDVSACIDRVMGELDALAARKSIALTRPANASALRIDADARRLHQILTDVVQNAIKFTPEGGRVDVGVQARGPEVEIVVRDTGPGIDEELLDAIRRRQLFCHGQDVHARRQGGLGLGLSLAKGLTELHGGRLEVASTKGQGACVSLFLPAAA